VARSAGSRRRAGVRLLRMAYRGSDSRRVPSRGRRGAAFPRGRPRRWRPRAGARQYQHNRRLWRRPKCWCT